MKCKEGFYAADWGHACEECGFGLVSSEDRTKCLGSEKLEGPNYIIPIANLTRIDDPEGGLC